jgi:hypothetical protein
VKTLEYKYKVLDPLISTQDWPALANQLPQSNTSSVIPLKTNIQMKSSQNTAKSASSSVFCCFLCQENHHIRDCPKNRASWRIKRLEDLKLGSMSNQRT